MKRRDFLKTAAIGIGATSVEGGCATVRGPGPDSFSVERMSAFLAQFDHGLAAIDRGERLGPLPRGDGAGGSGMVKRALRSMYAVGAVSDLTLEEQAHPGVQARMARLLPEMNQSLQECTASIQATMPRSGQQVRDALRDDPSLPLQLAEWVDDAGNEAGVSARTRRKFRAAATHVGFRLRHHDPAVLTGEYVGKVRKIEAWSGDEARLERMIAARVGPDVLARDQARFSAARLRWAALEVGATEPGAAPAEPPEKPGSAQLRAAAWAFGIALLFGAVGGVLVATSGLAGAFPLTVAVILLLVALVLAVIGLVKRAGASDDQEEPRNRGESAARPDRAHLPAPPAALPSSQET